MITATHNLTEQQVKFKETAIHIANYLVKEAIWDGNRCNWIGHVVEALNGKYQVIRRSFSRDFYNGTSGIAYFLALVLQYHDDPIIEETLEGCINQVLGMEGRTDDVGSNYGFYGGRVGVAYALIECGKMRNKQAWKNAGFALLDKVCEEEIKPLEIDVISGVAGGIPILLKYYKERNKHLYLATATKAADFLIEIAEKNPTSWGWTLPMSKQPLTGYSHGNAGDALALLEVNHVVQNGKYKTAAMYGFAYERQTYNPTVQNWPDLRDLSAVGGTDSGPTYAEAWCHGAPGIALSRLRAWELTGDQSFKQEAEVALGTTYRSVYNSLTHGIDYTNFGLCHGIAGNADVLLEGALQFENDMYRQLVMQVGEVGIEKYGKTGLNWPSGVNDPTGMTRGMQETPGFMLGLAGTGYFYLRLAFPEEVKCELVL